MTAPSTTVFEVQVSNKLPNEHIFVKLEAELQYATNVTSSSKNWDAKKAYRSTADSNNMEQTKYNKNAHAGSHFTDKKSHIKSSDHTSQHNSSTKASSTNVGVSGNYGLASMDVNVNHNKSSHETSSFQSHQTRDNLQHNI
eukprot:398333_1